MLQEADADLLVILHSYCCRLVSIAALNVLLLCSELHEHFLSVPEPIRLYIEEVKTQLVMLTNYNGPSMTLKEKWEFIKLTRHAFGRTALVLSGGGALGAFHLVRAQPKQYLSVPLAFVNS